MRILVLICSLLVFNLMLAQEGVQFEAVQISVNSPCNPVIFKGTKRSEYSKTAFLMPRLQLAKTSRGTDAIEFLNLSSGKKILQMGLYFPKFSIRNQTINYENYSAAECNYQQILNAINHRVNSENKVNRIVTLQIKNIKVEVDGVAEASKVASESTSILNYEGQIKKVEIPITADEQKDIVTRLTSNIGFNVNVNFEFLARKSNGHAEINISMSRLADEFKSGVAAKYSGPLEKIKLTQAEIQTTLGTAIASGRANMSGNVYTEESNNAQFLETARKVTEQILSQMNSSLGGQSGSQQNGTVLGTNNCDSQYVYGSDEYYDCVRNSSGGDSELPSPPKTSVDGENGINAKVFYSMLKQQKDINIIMSNNSENTTQTYTASMLIKKDDIENQRSLLSLASGSDVKNSRIKMEKGDEIIIYPHSEETQDIQYKKQTTYYSVENLNDPSSFKHFQKLDKLNLGRLDRQMTTGGDIGTFEEKKTNWVKVPNSLLPIPMVTYTKYSWGEENFIPVGSKPVSKSYSAILDDENKVVEKFNIGFIFNGKSPSKVYSLKKLMNITGSFIDIEYDYNRYAFVIKANEDLGYVKIKNLNKTLEKELALKKHFQDVKTRVMFQKEEKAKTVRVYSQYDKKTLVPAQINKQVLQLEKIHPFGQLDDGSFEIPVSVEDN